MGLISTVQEGLTEAVTQDVAFNIAAAWMSLHSADPGGSGAHEITAGTGPGGRQLVTFTGSGGTDSNAGDVVFDVPASTTVRWIGFWSTQTGGTFQGGFPTCGQPTVAVAVSGGPTVICPSHGFSPGDLLRPGLVVGVTSALPTPLLPDTTYQVGTVLSGDAFTLVPVGGGSDIHYTSTAGFQVAPDFAQTTGLTDQFLFFPNATGVVYATLS